MGVRKMDVLGDSTGGPAEDPIPRRHPCSRGLSRRLGLQLDRAARSGPRDRQLRQGLRVHHDLSRKSSGPSSSGRLHRLSVRRWRQGRSRSSSGPLRHRSDPRWRRDRSLSSSGLRHHLHGPRWHQDPRWPRVRRHHRHGRLLRQGPHRPQGLSGLRVERSAQGTCLAEIGSFRAAKSAGFACLTTVAWV